MEEKFINYFNSRNVGEDFYENYKLPLYFEIFLPKRKDIKILDFGCGFGQTIIALNDKGYLNVSGYDIEQEAINFCRKKGLTIHKTPPKNEKFDLIILSHVLEHIEKDKIIDQLGEIKELLNENGSLLINVPNAQSNTSAYWAYEDFTHSTIFTSGSIYYVLKQAGFQSIQFIDIDGTYGFRWYRKIVIKLLLGIYSWNISFWNKVTSSSYHKPSPQIFSYELKVLAKNK